MNHSRRTGHTSGFIGVAATLLLLAMTTTVVAQNADLSVMKTGPSSIVANTSVEYTVTVSNFSGEDSTPTNTLIDSFPAELTFTGALVPDGWSCTAPPLAGPNTITCTSANAIANESVLEFMFVFQVSAGASVGTLVTNSANIAHNGSDGNSENNNSSFTSTVVTEPPPPVTGGGVLISEFRLSGPNGANDDYIELYCNRDLPCDISGFTIQSYDPALPGEFSITIPGQTIIPARQFLLIGDEADDGPFNNGYSLSTYAVIDLLVPSGGIPDFFKDNQGIQLLDDEAVRVDSVGFIGGGNAENFIEGTGLQPSESRPADQYAYVRKRTMVTNGRPQDTNNNADDFVLVSVRPENAHPGISTLPVLGAPGPKSLTGPQTYSNQLFPGDLLDPGVSTNSSPNRVRVGSGNSGTLSIRRSVTNNTNQSFDRIVFRVIEIPTVNSPVTVDNQAIFHLQSSGDEGPFTNSLGRNGFLHGTTLEYDNICGCEPAHPHGGGLNSSVAISPVFIAPGDTVDFQLLVDVERSGNYRFWVYVEAYPAEEEERSKQGATSTTSGKLRPSPKGVQRMMLHGKNSARGLSSKQKVRRPVLTPLNGGPAISTAPTTKLAPPRVIILNRYKAEDEKKPRRKTRVRRKSSVTLKKKAEEKFTAEKPQN